MLPCNYIHQYLGYKEDKVSDECDSDLKNQIAYLGTSIDVLIYFNDEQFVPNEYGESAIRRESRIIR